MNDIQALKKLKECDFFLEEMENQKDVDEFDYYFSVFLSAWRSVLDVLLYDYAIIYDLGFSREDRMDPWQFKWAANKLVNQKALKFFSWWNDKRESLRKYSLWEDRVFYVHRGYPETASKTIYVPASMSSSVAYVSIDGIPLVPDGHSIINIYDEGRDLLFPDTIDECKNGLKEMYEIVSESIRKFRTK